ncbi:histone acetyltransferase subunit NuA4-domain-containing protein [Catenaria anguillulae PL171]|uniref:Chromatin modification-related protein EAF6 n=1 Tax=Catenaria anguillulae PL171 TaxID=765915 RepID=A0A1Y2HJR2_9FUNG|nr:histone acetyltransferase subunit NuA4-domain-containing protein [Catenaria anguillulae PL171]
MAKPSDATPTQPNQHPAPPSATGTATTGHSTPSSDPAAAAKIAQKAAEDELKSLLEQKQRIERNMMEIEYRIFNLEGSYLEDTVAGGNILRGFDGYLAGRPDKKQRTTRGPIDPADRIFSNSSTTYKESITLVQQLKDAGGDLRFPPPVANWKQSGSAPSASGSGSAGRSSKKASHGVPGTPAGIAGAAGAGAAASATKKRKRARANEEEDE